MSTATDPATEHQITELLSFLLHPNPQLCNLSLVNLLPYTVHGSPYRHLFSDTKVASGPAGSAVANPSEGIQERGYIKVLAGVARASKEVSTRQSALTALVNLTDSVTTCTKLVALDGFLDWVLHSAILDTSSGLGQVGSMLLANLSKLESVCRACLNIEKGDGVKSIAKLVDIFAAEEPNLGDEPSTSTAGTYDYLANVFANISAVNIKDGRESLLGMPASLTTETAPVPLAELVIFTEHRSPVRRAGISSTLKNSAFVSEAHPLLLSSCASSEASTSSTARVNFLPYILLPLCGSEEFDLEESDKFPDELQLLGEDKQREKEPTTRLMLVETLVLLCKTREGRDILRNKGVYEVVKVLHIWERDEDVRIAIERLVNLLMSYESEESKVEEVKEPAEEEDEDMQVQEV